MPEAQKTPLTALYLSKLCEQITQNQVVKLSRLPQSVVSAHCAGTRSIRDNHIDSYLNAVPTSERKQLLATWIKDVIEPALQEGLITADNRLNESVVSWQPNLDPEVQRKLSWWAQKLTDDPELLQIFNGITYKAGYPQSEDDSVLSSRLTDPSSSYGKSEQPNAGKIPANKLMRP